MLKHATTYYTSLSQTSAAWKEARKHFALTASEMGMALGLSDSGKSKVLFSLKRQGKERVFSSYVENKILKWGKDHESHAIACFASLFPTYGPKLKETGIHPFDDLYGASPDRLIVDFINGSDVTAAIVECKCPWGKKIYKEMRPALYQFIGVKSDERKEIQQVTKEKPVVKFDHYVQMQAQMRATGTTTCFYCIWAPTEFVVLEIWYDEKLWVQTLKPNLDEFCNAVKFRAVPEDDVKEQYVLEGSADILDILPHSLAKVKFAVRKSQLDNSQIIGVVLNNKIAWSRDAKLPYDAVTRQGQLGLNVVVDKDQILIL